MPGPCKLTLLRQFVSSTRRIAHGAARGAHGVDFGRDLVFAHRRQVTRLQRLADLEEPAARAWRARSSGRFRVSSSVVMILADSMPQRDGWIDAWFHY